MPSTPHQGRGIGLCILAALWPQLAFGQTPGSRAAGMAEAFVAVADDATAIFWNPAGLATGAFLSLVVDYGAGERVPDETAPAGEQTTTFIGLTVPPLGLGYYRLRRVGAVPATPEEMAQPGREEGRQSVQGLTTSHLGLTLGQSLGDYVVVAGTVKYVQGEVTAGSFEGGSGEALDAADRMPTRSTSRADVDAGAMLAVEQWRVGVVARNLTTPTFHQPDASVPDVELEREVRVGVAWGPGWPGISRLVVSSDADLTRNPGLAGERRDLAVGVETWWLRQRLGVRGGVRGSTVGDARTTVAGGVSAAVRSGVFVEGHVARGEQDGRSWSIGARITF